ncbi:MAG: DUF4212 domain-containing protein [Planctomycetes bacterium]|nr:DUF4212 domain-containing protein [Planctomycetota bacterium]
MTSHPPPRGQRYWLRNVRLVALLLVLWFAVSYGAGILLAPWLNNVRLPGTGFRLGFWMAQQGSMLAFVALIFFYARRMDRIEREEGLDERDEEDAQ